MATLVLTAVGTLVGGPIGGAIGSILGQQLDQSLFGPKARQGPRLGNLAIQTSSYGTDIPKIFGTMRVAGTVIWATDLIERRATSGGKGRPKTTNYSYSANFAVVLSGRPIIGVRRIWADGKLLRGVAGDFKTSTGYRLHPGREDQLVDPLIASAEGLNAPGFRGLAYAVFENFQLEDYGNRIPSLTFEVQADAGDVTAGIVARTLAGPLIEVGETVAVAGYAASGDSVRAAIEPLAEIASLSLSDRPGGMVRLGWDDDAAFTIMADRELTKRQITRHAAGSAPAEVGIAYYDTAKDFQTGVQRAADQGASTRNVERRALPAALSPGQAKHMAEKRLKMLRAARVEVDATIGWQGAAIRPGDTVALSEAPGSWRVKGWTLGEASLALKLSRIAETGSSDLPAAEAGAGDVQPDVAHGPTTLQLMDLPLGDPVGGRLLLFAAAAGVAPGWRRASTLVSFDDGATWQDSGSTAPSAVMGFALTALGMSGGALFDLGGQVEVELLNAEMWLEGVNDFALTHGANLAALGGELIQFGQAEHVSGRRFRLSRLLRGRRGTEWAIPDHAVGEAFTLIERDTLLAIEAPTGSAGGVARLSASGVGDDGPVVAATPMIGSSLQPPAPVHLRAARLTNGDLAIAWTRRSRLGWSWLDGGDVPLGEEREEYLMTVSGSGGEREFPLSVSQHLYSTADQAADGLSGAVTIQVVQLGTYARSRAAITTID